jgi:23S rRNA (pseudouridine1915-N3)-methyltransferase
MRVVFCFSGKTFKGPIAALVDDYRERIAKYAPVEIIEAKTLKRQTRDGVHIVLAPEGKVLDSLSLADFLSEQMGRGTKNLFFYTGAPTGCDAGLEAKADLVLSMSAMTFNHQVVRIMLLEQVYRAFTIIHKEPYHK